MLLFTGYIFRDGEMAWCVGDADFHTSDLPLPLYVFCPQIKFGLVLSDSRRAFRQTSERICLRGSGLCASYRFGMKPYNISVCTFSVTSGLRMLFGQIYNAPNNKSQHHSII